MIVYNFTSHKNAVSNLKYKRLKISKIEELNDPFELYGAQLANKELRTGFKKMREELANNRGLICFSESWHNPLLWSHYGDKHYGVCMGFEIPKIHLQKVNYVPSRKLLEFSPADGKTTLNENSMEKLLCQKYEDWSYEAEYRAWVNLDEKDNKTGLYFIEFSKNIRLKEIVLGSRNTSTPNDLKNIIGVEIKGVKIIKSRLAFQSYKVVKNKKFKTLAT